MVDVVNDPDLADVTAGLRAQALAAFCVCGKPKWRRVFCEFCIARLADIYPAATCLFWSLRDELDARALRRYDVCCDILRNPDLAQWKAKRTRERHRRQAEFEG